MQRIGVGLIGTGFMGKCHAMAYGSVKAVFGDVPVVERVSLCDVEPGRAAQMRRRIRLRRIDDASGAICSPIPDIDLISITSPNGLHREMAVAALEAGKHVWCEKPMALTLADAEAMAKAAAAASGAGDGAGLRLSAQSGPAVRPVADRRGRHRRVLRFPRQRRRGLHGRPCIAMVLAPLRRRMRGWARSPT